MALLAADEEDEDGPGEQRDLDRHKAVNQLLAQTQKEVSAEIAPRSRRDGPPRWPAEMARRGDADARGPAEATPTRHVAQVGAAEMEMARVKQTLAQLLHDFDRFQQQQAQQRINEARQQGWNGGEQQRGWNGGYSGGQQPTATLDVPNGREVRAPAPS